MKKTTRLQSHGANIHDSQCGRERESGADHNTHTIPIHGDRRGCATDVEVVVAYKTRYQNKLNKKK